jgi:hypothetical protein
VRLRTRTRLSCVAEQCSPLKQNRTELKKLEEIRKSGRNSSEKRSLS